MHILHTHHRWYFYSDRFKFLMIISWSIHLLYHGNVSNHCTIKLPETRRANMAKSLLGAFLMSIMVCVIASMDYTLMFLIRGFTKRRIFYKVYFVQGTSLLSLQQPSTHLASNLQLVFSTNLLHFLSELAIAVSKVA